MNDATIAWVEDAATKDDPSDEAVERLVGHLGAESAWDLDQLRRYVDSLSSDLVEEALVDLVDAHLQHAWAGGNGALLEDYQRTFSDHPSFRSLDAVPVDLVEQEFIVRHAAEAGGDHPTVESYERRFEGREDVVETLRQKLMADGRYVRLSVIGAGGLGRVWLAYDYHMRRRVAIKVPFHHDADSGQRRRLMREALVTAKLNHPSIVTVHEYVAENGDDPFYVMPLVPGKTLARETDEFHQRRSEMSERNARLAERELLNRLTAVCDAVQYAHEQGIVHRDLKPSNVKVGQNGETILLDWGLAREASTVPGMPDEADGYDAGTTSGDTDESARTVGAGTRGYVCYQQLYEHDVSPAGDVYSLGAILYAILTGRGPLPGGVVTERDFTAWLKQGKVERPSRRRKQVARPLEAICLKALDPVPERRYTSARALAEDIDCFLADEAVAALPEPVYSTRRMFRRLRRHRIWVAVAAVALLVGGVFSAREWRQAETRADRSLRARYAADMELASRYWDQGRADRVVEILRRQQTIDAPKDLLNWEWCYLTRAAHDVSTINTTPDDDVMSMAMIDSRRFALAVGTDVEIWSRGGRLNRLRHHRAPITAQAVSPDGTMLASAAGDSDVVLWDLTAGKKSHVLREHILPVQSMAFSQDGRRLVTGGSDAVVKVWDTETGRELHGIRGRHREISHVGFVNGAKTVLAITGPLENGDSVALTWDLDTGKSTATVRIPRKARQVAIDEATSRVAVLCGDRRLRIWRLAEKAELVSETPIDIEHVSSLAFGASETDMLLGCRDRTIRVVTLPSGDVSRTFRGHREEILAVVRRDSLIVSASRDGQIRFWDLNLGDAPRAVGHTLLIRGVKFFPDGKSFVTTSYDKTIRVWSDRAEPLRVIGETEFERDPESGVIVSATSRGAHQGLIMDVDVSPDGTRIATAGFEDNSAIVWDAATGRRLRVLQHSLAVNAVAFRGNSKLATACWDGIARIWDVESGEELRSLEGHDAAVKSIACSPDGTLIATGSEDHTVRLWRARDGRYLRTLNAHDGEVRALAFSPDRQWLATGSDDTTVCLWPLNGESVTESRMTRLRGHLDGIRRLTFSPDGSRLVTAGTGTLEDIVRVWDPKLGALVTVLPGHSNVAFSPDGRRLAVGESASVIRLLDGGEVEPELMRQLAAGNSPAESSKVAVTDRPLDDPHGGLRLLGYRIAGEQEGPDERPASRTLMVVLSFPLRHFQESPEQYRSRIEARPPTAKPLPPRERTANIEVAAFTLLLPDGREVAAEPTWMTWPDLRKHTAATAFLRSTHRVDWNKREARVLTWKVSDSVENDMTVRMMDFAPVPLPSAPMDR